MSSKSRHVQREKDPSSRTLKVKGLSHRTTETDVKELFEKYGRIRDVLIPRDKFSKENRGYALVTFYHKRHAERAYKAVRNKKVDGRKRKLEIEDTRELSRRHKSRSRERSRPRSDQRKSTKGKVRRISPKQGRVSDSEGHYMRRISSTERQERLHQRVDIKKRKSRSPQRRRLAGFSNETDAGSSGRRERNLPPKVWASPHIHTCFRCRKPYRHFHRFSFPYHKQHSGQCPNRSCDAYHNGFNERYAEPVTGNEVREWEKKYGRERIKAGNNRLAYM